jgi:hypothetical protein
MTTFSVTCLNDQAYSKLITLQTLRWLQHGPPKQQYAPTKLLIYQKTTVLTNTIKKTPEFKFEQADAAATIQIVFRLYPFSMLNGFPHILTIFHDFKVSSSIL